MGDISIGRSNSQQFMCRTIIDNSPDLYLSVVHYIPTTSYTQKYAHATRL